MSNFVEGNMWTPFDEDRMAEVNKRVGPSIRKSPVAPESGRTKSERFNGKILVFKEHSGFGYIQINGEPDLFFHISAFSSYRTSVNKGELVTFEISTGKNGRTCAANITLGGN